jgi:uncharacterized membrane protein YphA (DoxX/SURF4 family)
MYNFILATHNIVRWLILVAAVVVIVQAFVGWLGKREWSKADNLAGIIYVSVIDLNILLGFILYLFLSPLTRQAFVDFGAAMGNPVLRFFAVEHIFMMLVALALAHVGRSLSKKATEPIKKHRAAAIWYTLSLLAILFMIPWDRPLWPLS